MNATKPLAVLFAVLLVGTGAVAAAGSSYRTGTDSYAMDATLDDGTVTVAVDHGGSGVANATVYANGDRVGTTDENGTVSFALGDDDELDLTAEADGVEMHGEFAVDDGSLALQQSDFDHGGAADEHEDENADERERNRDDRADREQSGDDDNAMSADASASASASASADRRGPPSEMPDQASDRATSAHGVIQKFLSGDVANLGHALGDLLGGGDAAHGQGN